MSAPFDPAALPEAERADAESVISVCPGARPLRYADGEVILAASDASRDVVLLLRGSALAIAPDADPARRVGKEIAVLEARPGAPVFIGEMAALDEGARTATIVSAMTAWGLRLAAADLDRIIESLPALTRILCRTFSERLRSAGDALGRMRAQSALDARHEARSPGDCLFTRGQPADALWQLLEGEVALTDPAGERRVRPAPNAPCLLDLRAYLCGAPHTATATATAPCLLLAMDAAARDAVVRNHPAAVRALLAQG